MRVRNELILTVALACWSAVAPAVGHAQGEGTITRFGAGVKASTLGAGIDVAAAVTRKSNVRVGFNAFSYNDTFSKDGINYGANLRLRSVEILYDQYLVGGLHISPGFLVYNGNGGTAAAAVPGGQSFSLGGTTYYSAAANPVVGTAALTLGKAAPMILFGVGNLVPRSHRHFSVGFETGVVFEGSPNATLNLMGSACTSQGALCQTIASNPAIQSNIISEQNKINNSMTPFKYYPVVSLEFGYKF
jgi:hypothetical protein